LSRICTAAITNSTLYSVVERKSCIPWPVIAAIHYRESDQDFKRHFHNGDPLTARTVHVPQGRPATGSPPFTWIDSATDALNGGLWRPHNWAIEDCLEFMERYNGVGYQKRGINSPYVWDFTNQYTSGLFISDGTFDANKKESRAGGAAFLIGLYNLGVSLDFRAFSDDTVLN